MEDSTQQFCRQNGSGDIPSLDLLTPVSSYTGRCQILFYPTADIWLHHENIPPHQSTFACIRCKIIAGTCAYITGVGTGL